MSLDGMSLKEARKLLDSIKEKLELVLSKNRDSEIITNGNSHEKNDNSTIIHNQNGDSKKENNDSQQPKEDGKKEKVFNCQTQLCLDFQLHVFQNFHMINIYNQKQ